RLSNSGSGVVRALETGLASLDERTEGFVARVASTAEELAATIDQRTQAVQQRLSASGHGVVEHLNRVCPRSMNVLTASSLALLQQPTNSPRRWMSRRSRSNCGSRLQVQLQLRRWSPAWPPSRTVPMVCSDTSLRQLKN